MEDTTISDIVKAYTKSRERLCAANTRKIDDKGYAAIAEIVKAEKITMTSELTMQHAERHMAWRNTAGKSPRTINIEMGSAKRMFDWAVQEKMCESNPLKGWKNSKDHGVRERRKFSPAEVHELLANVDDSWLPLMQLFVCTGMRRCEALELEWAEVRLERAIIRLPRERTKTGEPRNVILGPRMVEMLRVLPRLGKFVFANPETGKPYVVLTPGRKMKSAARRAGWTDLSGVSPQTFRRTFANDVYHRTHDTVLVDTLLGHKGDLNKQCYVEADEADLREQAAKVEAVMLGEEA